LNPDGESSTIAVFEKEVMVERRLILLNTPRVVRGFVRRMVEIRIGYS